MEQKTEKNNLKLVALISALTIVILELIVLINRIINSTTIYTTPIGYFLSLILIVFVGFKLIQKNKIVEAAILILYLVLIPEGLVFIRRLLGGTLGFTILNGLLTFAYFAVMVLFIIFLLGKFKTEKLKYNLVCPCKSNLFILGLATLGFMVLFVGFEFAIYYMLALVFLISIESDELIAYLSSAYFIIYIFDFFDFFIDKKNIPGYKLGTLNWIEIIIGIVFFAFSVISIFKPNLLEKNKEEVQKE